MAEAQTRRLLQHRVGDAFAVGHAPAPEQFHTAALDPRRTGGDHPARVAEGLHAFGHARVQFRGGGLADDVHHQGGVAQHSGQFAGIGQDEAMPVLRVAMITGIAEDSAHR